MPNGGVPIHMVLTPGHGEGVVLYCHGSELRIINRADWESAGVNAPPLAILSPREALVLERFLRYWLHDSDTGPLFHEPGVNAKFDF